METPTPQTSTTPTPSVGLQPRVIEPEPQAPELPPLTAALLRIAEARPEALRFRLGNEHDYVTVGARGIWVLDGAFVPFHLTRGGSPVHTPTAGVLPLLGWLFALARAEGLVYSVEGGGKIGWNDVTLIRETDDGPQGTVGRGVDDDLCAALATALAEALSSPTARGSEAL